MALSFGSWTTNKVNVGSNSVLDNPAVGTLFAWAYPTSFVANAGFYGKGAGLFSRNPTFTLSGTAGAISFIINRASTHLTIISGSSFLSTNLWQCVTAVWNVNGVNGDQRLYVGNLTTAIAEVGSYANQAVGLGTPVDRSADDAAIGNRDATASNGFSGFLALIAIWDRVLSLDELVSIQFRPRVTNGCVGFWCLGYNGTGTQPDWSGNANNGTVTGATVADHVPIPFRRSGPLYVPYTVAALGNTWPGYQSASGWY